MSLSASSDYQRISITADAVVLPGSKNVMGTWNTQEKRRWTGRFLLSPLSD